MNKFNFVILTILIQDYIVSFEIYYNRCRR